MAAAFLAAWMGLFSPSSRAQSIKDLVKTLGIENIARGYLQPVADALGAGFNSGFYHSAAVPRGFHLYGGLKSIWIFIPPANRQFIATLPPELTALGYPSSITTATVFGSKGAVVRSSTDTAKYPSFTMPDGIDSDQFMLIIPQISIGSIFGSEIVIRGIPPTMLDPAIGRVSLVGVGIKHSTTQYAVLPFDIAVMAAAQRFTLDDVLKVTNYNVNVILSVDLLAFTLYAGAGYEGYQIVTSYRYEPDPTNSAPGLDKEFDFSLDFTGLNRRITLGMNIQVIPLVDINIDYGFGGYDTATLGIGFAI
ncbi:MAG: hypothetical protein GXO82_08195 [Chlorobi bacterium]|nr:hypothetical protein [Chlorobiota bacterium]